MIFTEWMSYLRDEARLVDVVIPGAHNAGSKGMNFMACCQDGTLYEQFRAGVRHFCLRLSTDRYGRIRIAHGVTMGILLTEALDQIKQMLAENESEFLILDLREYYPQQFGPFVRKYEADPAEVDLLLKRYIDPAKYAYTDFGKPADITIGDLRKSGKRYLLVNYKREYEHSVDCECILPWNKQLFGSDPKYFAAHCTDLFDTDHTDGFYWFQTQQTPNLGTEIGMTPPDKLDAEGRQYFEGIIRRIAQTPEYLAQANIIGCDFITRDLMKTRAILRLNLDKDNIEPSLRDEFAAGLEE